MSEYATYQSRRCSLNALTNSGGFSEVVDVFTILRRADNGPANEMERSRRDDPRPETPENSNNGSKPSPVSLKQYRIEEEEIEPQEVAYRSVRKPPQGHGTNDTMNGEDNWEAAKAVMR